MSQCPAPLLHKGLCPGRFSWFSVLLTPMQFPQFYLCVAPPGIKLLHVSFPLSFVHLGWDTKCPAPGTSGLCKEAGGKGWKKWKLPPQNLELQSHGISSKHEFCITPTSSPRPLVPELIGNSGHCLCDISVNILTPYSKFLYPVDSFLLNFVLWQFLWLPFSGCALT